MAHMVKIRSGPAALQRAARIGGDSSRLRPSIRALHTRTIATNAAIREPDGSYPLGLPPVPESQRSTALDRRETIKNAKPFSDFLTDTFNRQHDYLRISITERCNLRCLYCMPEEGIPLSPSANMLTTPEIVYLSSLFVSQGVTKIRLTGGEPTVRRDIVPLMQQIGNLRPKGLRELALTTNGIALHRKLDTMVEAGLTGVNLSLDTLDPFQFQIMTRRKGFDVVMKSIDRILEMNKLGANVKLKVNCVVMRGLNEREILPFVELGREKNIEVRFIEYMPFGGNKWSENKMISFQEMLDIIKAKYPELRRVPGHKNDTSKTFEVPGFVGKVGFITSMTNDFCGTCNRLRITSDGNLKVCLHGNAEVSLRDLLRQDNGGEPIDEIAFERLRKLEIDRRDGRLGNETTLGWGQRERELLNVIGTAVKRKEEKHADLKDLANMENRPMILIDRTNSYKPPRSQQRSSQYHSKSLYTTTALLPGVFPSILELHSSMPLMPASTRAYSTTRNAILLDSIKAESEERAMFRAIKRDSIKTAPLPPHYEHLRQKYDMASERYNGYWQLVARTKLARPSNVKHLERQADKELHEKQADVWRGRENERPDLPDHKALMAEVQDLADVNAVGLIGKVRKANMETITSDMKELQEYFTTFNILTADEKQISETRNKIKRLGRDLAAETPRDGAAAPKNWKEFQESPDGKVKLALTSAEKRQTKRAAWRAQKKAAADLAREMLMTEKVREKALQDRELKEKALQDLKDSLESCKGQLITVKVAWSAEKARRGKAQQQRIDLITKKRELLQQLQVQNETQRKAKLASITERRESNKLKIPMELEDIMDEAVGKSDKAFGVPEGLEDSQYHKLDRQPIQSHTEIRIPEEFRAKRDALLKQREAKLAVLKKLQSSVIHDVEFSHTVHTIEENEPILRTDHMDEFDSLYVTPTGEAIPNDEAIAWLERRGKKFGTSMPSSKPVSGKVQDTQLSPHTDRIDVFGSKSTPITMPLSQSSQVSKIEDLHLSIPSSGLIEIDSELTINLEASVPSLQSQLKELQERLSGVYPRIDNLPFHVWKSSNRRTLQTWLKILSSRWHKRSDDDIGRSNNETAVDARVQKILDQMVRDHDLSNEAAERMAMRWAHIFEERQTRDIHGEEDINWDEFEAGGMGFLREDDIEFASENAAEAFEAPAHQDETATLSRRQKAAQLVQQGKRPEVWVKSKDPELSSLTSRLYSSSSRPSTEPNPGPKPGSSSTSSPSLPHLTPTGTAHMVSVSTKVSTSRTATAVGTVFFSNATPLSLIQRNALKKGDVLSVARIAGIMAAKKCPDLVPLCHPIALTSVSVDVHVFEPTDKTDTPTNDFGFGGVSILATVQCVGPTGVEMEALTAVMGAALSVVDMCKAVDRFQRVMDVRVVLKEGGKSGTWREEGWEGK